MTAAERTPASGILLRQATQRRRGFVTADLSEREHEVPPLLGGRGADRCSKRRNKALADPQRLRHRSPVSACNAPKQGFLVIRLRREKQRNHPNTKRDDPHASARSHEE